MTSEQAIASGIFHWYKEERTEDRYGRFYVTHSTDRVQGRVAFDETRMRALVGKRVRILCEVVEARKSGHVGDLYHKIFPTTPNKGEVVDLGVGIFNVVEGPPEGSPQFSLEPTDGRKVFWMDPHKLYRLHDQTVRVFVHPTTDEFSAAPNLKTPDGPVHIIVPDYDPRDTN
jgi:hypothetical protein